MTKWIEFNGKKQTLAQWGEELGIARRTLGARIATGWSIEKVLTTPVRKQREDLTGQIFGRLTAVEFSHDDVSPRKGGGKNYCLMWKCKCACGKTVTINAKKLKSGNTKSCGCLLIEQRITHGRHKSREYRTWIGIKSRCYNPNNTGYPSYGGRGIKVCDRWLESFENFLADMGECPDFSMSIDRIDNDGDYAPDNCEWRTIGEQANNRRDNRLLEFAGRTQTVAQWARKFGISPITIGSRLRDGWSVKRALTTPAKVIDILEFNGKKQNLAQWSAEFGISYDTLWRRMKRGWSIEKALTTPIDTRKSRRHRGRQL
jgi:hypothetical protein